MDQFSRTVIFDDDHALVGSCHQIKMGSGFYQVGNAAPACDHRFRDPGNHAAAV